MADDIDYDELDQALRGAIRHENKTKTPTTSWVVPLVFNIHVNTHTIIHSGYLKENI